MCIKIRKIKLVATENHPGGHARFRLEVLAVPSDPTASLSVQSLAPKSFKLKEKTHLLDSYIMIYGN